MIRRLLLVAIILAGIFWASLIVALWLILAPKVGAL